MSLTPMEAARRLTPEQIRKTAEHLEPAEIKAWYCDISGKKCPPKRLVRQAVEDHCGQPFTKKSIPADCIAVLSHHGFLCRNLDWATD